MSGNLFAELKRRKVVEAGANASVGRRRRAPRFWQRVSLRRQILYAFAVPVVLVVLASLFQLYALVTLNRGAETTAASSEAIGLRYALLNSVLDAETGLRGYLLAGDPEFLQPYFTAQENFDTISKRLQASDARNPAQLQKLHQIETLFQSWQQEYAKPQMELREKLGIDMPGEQRIYANVASKRGKRIIDAIRTVLQASLQEALAEQHAAEAAAETDADRALWIGLLLPVLALLVGLVLALLLLVDAIRAIDATSLAAKAVAGGDLQKRVNVSRKDEIGELGSSFNHMAEELADHRRRSETINRFQTLLVTSNSMEEIYSVVARICEEIFPPGASGAIYRMAASRDLATRVAQWNWPDAANGRVLHPEDCRAIRAGKPYFASSDSLELPCQHTQQLGVPVKRGICLPLSAHGDILGVLQLCRFGEITSDAASARDIGTAVVIGEQLSLSMANMQLHEKLRNQSIRDPLTGLFNRRYLEETMQRELARSARNGQPLAVVAIDVDHFKRFNDSHGHEAGDKVLIELAAVLRQGIRSTDIACRFGGEEFVLLMPDSPLTATVERIEAIRRQVQQLRVTVNGIPLEAITISGGIAIAPTHGESGDVLLRNADTALYQAKHTGRDRAVVYQSS
jgi:diguanylate cyclase (GGDEF)-like protein